MKTKNQVWLTILMVFTFSLHACKTEQKATDNSASNNTEVEEADSLLASITRTPCYGTCPHYSIHIYKSGYVVYEGKQFVKTTGKKTARLNDDKLNEIKDLAVQLGYYELEDRYESKMTDFPSCTTVMNTKEHGKKEVFHYGKAPDNLIKFEKYLDGLFANKGWLK